MIYSFIDYAKNIITRDSDILNILESYSITEPLNIQSAFLVITRENSFYRVILSDTLFVNARYDIQDKIYNKYKIDMEILENGYKKN